MTFATPQLLWLLIIPAALLVWEFTRARRTAAVTQPKILRAEAGAEPQILSETDRPNSLSASARSRLWLYAGLSLATSAGARPQIAAPDIYLESDGKVVVFALDLSSSMLTEDYGQIRGRSNRLEAIRSFLQKSVRRQSSAQVGLVAFAGEVRILLRPTLHTEALSDHIKTIQVGLLKDGTAIGDGLDAALKLIPPSAAPSQNVVVLITDGLNNRGTLTPTQSAEAARSRNIPIHTVVMGGSGVAPFPMFDKDGNKIGYQRVLSDLDPKPLFEIASKTGGRFFHAVTTESIEAAFSEIESKSTAQAEPRRPGSLMQFYPWLSACALAAACGSIISARSANFASSK